MADLSQLLAQLLGQREEEQPNLNPQAPNTTPGTRGLFARRPVMGRPSGDYQDVAPMPPNWGRMAVPQPPQPPAPPSYDFPFPMGGPAPAPHIPVAQGPQAPHVSVMHGSNPGAYNDFPAYNDAMQTWHDPQRRSGPHIRADYGDPQTSRALLPRRGLEPPTAPRRAEPAPLSMEDEAWQAARARAHEAIATDRREELSRLPRPGRPLIAQAWSAPSRRNRRDDR